MNDICYGLKRISRSSFVKLCSALGLRVAPSMIANFCVTSKCNMRCRTCTIGENYLREPGIADDDLSAEEIRRLFLREASFLRDVNWIQITGGEPFLRKDLARIIGIISETLPRCRIWIATNGFFTEAIREVLTSVLNKDISLGVGVSLHGTRETHDLYTGVSGSYDRAINTIGELTALRNIFPRLRVSVGFTLSKDNFRDLSKAYRISKSLDVDFTFRPTNYSELYYNNRKEDISYGQHIADIEKEVKTLIGEMSSEFRILLSPRKAIRLYYFNGVLKYIGDPGLRRLGCLAGMSSFFLDAKGNVFPCLGCNKKLGNIRERNLKDIFASDLARSVQLDIRKGRCSNCWVECETYRSIYENIGVVIFFWVSLIFKNSFPRLFKDRMRNPIL